MESAVSSAVGSRADGTRTPRRTGAMAPAPRSPRADGGPQPSLWFRHAGAGVLLCLLLVSGTVRTDGAGGPCLGGAQLCHLVAGPGPGAPQALVSLPWKEDLTVPTTQGLRESRVSDSPPATRGLLAGL